MYLLFGNSVDPDLMKTADQDPHSFSYTRFIMNLHTGFTENQILQVAFVCVGALCLSQQFFSHVVTNYCLPRLNQ